MKFINKFPIKSFIVTLIVVIPFSTKILAFENIKPENDSEPNANVPMNMDSSENKNNEKSQNSMSMKMDSNENKDKSKSPDLMSMKMDSNDNKATGTRDPNANSGGYEYRGMDGWEKTDEMTVSKIIFDQLEYRKGNNTEFNRWDMQGWKGTDYDKFWVKFEGLDIKSENSGEFEFQALYSKAVSAYWDLQYGARYDRSYGNGMNDERYFGVIGFQGLAPYWFEVEPALFMDSNGEISARVVASYDLLFSQRLILQPRIEINASASNLPELGIGQGVNNLQFDLRLRYEFIREIAPYVGITWQKKYGDSAVYSQQQGSPSEFTEVVLGVRVWF
jgi:copper resistance protein B